MLQNAICSRFSSERAEKQSGVSGAVGTYLDGWYCHGPYKGTWQNLETGIMSYEYERKPVKRTQLGPGWQPRAH